MLAQPLGFSFSLLAIARDFLIESPRFREAAGAFHVLQYRINARGVVRRGVRAERQRLRERFYRLEPPPVFLVRRVLLIDLFFLERQLRRWHFAETCRSRHLCCCRLRDWRHRPRWRRFGNLPWNSRRDFRRNRRQRAGLSCSSRRRRRHRHSAWFGITGRNRFFPAVRRRHSDRSERMASALVFVSSRNRFVRARVEFGVLLARYTRRQAGCLAFDVDALLRDVACCIFA